LSSVIENLQPAKILPPRLATISKFTRLTFFSMKFVFSSSRWKYPSKA
jgi:hypothetical protein